jgi:hypothetical protein
MDGGPMPGSPPSTPLRRRSRCIPPTSSSWTDSKAARSSSTENGEAPNEPWRARTRGGQAPPSPGARGASTRSALHPRSDGAADGREVGDEHYPEATVPRAYSARGEGGAGEGASDGSRRPGRRCSPTFHSAAWVAAAASPGARAQEGWIRVNGTARPHDKEDTS